MATPEFTRFANLPTELRSIIWSLAYDLQAPRIVEIRPRLRHCVDYVGRSYVCPRHDYRCPRYSPSAKPSLMLVNREAREVTRKRAEAAGHVLFAGGPGDDIFFNPAIDTLYIPDTELWGGIANQYVRDSGQPCQVRFFAMDLALCSAYFRPMCDFSNLQRLIFVVSPSSEIKVTLARHTQMWGVFRSIRKHWLESSPTTSCLAAIHDGRFKIIEELWSY